MTQGSRSPGAALLTHLALPLSLMLALLIIDITMTIDNPTSARSLHSDAVLLVLVATIVCTGVWIRRGLASPSGEEPAGSSSTEALDGYCRGYADGLARTPPPPPAQNVLRLRGHN